MGKLVASACGTSDNADTVSVCEVGSVFERQIHGQSVSRELWYTLILPALLYHEETREAVT